MATISLPSSIMLLPAIVPPVPIRRFTVAEYREMIRTGILKEDDAVELLEGWVVPKMPRNPEHDSAISILSVELLGKMLPDGWFCRGQSAIDTNDSQPEPDIAVVRGRPRDYRDHHPGPGEMALVIEVADSLLSRDRTLKARIYAAAGVPVYWIVNLADRCVEVYSEPSGAVAEPSYRRIEAFDAGAMLPRMIDGRQLPAIAVRDILP